VGNRIAIVLDNKVTSAPVIQDKILGGRGQISGNFNTQTASELAMLLRSGALPADIEIIEERTVGPGLGQDSINSGAKAAAVGIAAIFTFAIVYYGIMGLFVVMSLALNLAILIGVMSMFGITLTLPGIAGMVLTLAMAIDANVLIYERTKEEKRRGKSPFASLEDGFNLAWRTILDSNLTTLFAAFFLFQFGSGPIRGFAVALSLGIITSIFTSVTVLKMIIWGWIKIFQPKDIPL
jgi:protein-export membrane protein SecD